MNHVDSWIVFNSESQIKLGTLKYSASLASTILNDCDIYAYFAVGSEKTLSREFELNLKSYILCQ